MILNIEKSTYFRRTRPKSSAEKSSWDGKVQNKKPKENFHTLPPPMELSNINTFGEQWRI